MSRGLQHRLAQTVVRRALWGHGDTVAVAVSGGRDSICLLDLLVASAGIHGGRLRVVTFDHGTRADSGEDVDFVREVARRYGLSCEVHVAQLGPDASEDSCRRARRAAWDALDVDRIALGHHMRDQAETALLGMMRGGGTAAFGGMRWIAGRYVRPMLDLPPEALADWCVSRRLEWREDPTNASPRYLRNRVRHELLPMLESLRPGTVAALARGAGHASEDDAYLSEICIEQDPFDGSRWPQLWLSEGRPALVRRSIRRHLGEVHSGLVDAVIHTARRGLGQVVVSERVKVVVDAPWVFIVRGGGPGD